MIPQFIGMLMVLATFGLVAVGFAMLLIGSLRKDRLQARRGGRVVTATLAVYGILWLVGFATGPKGLVPLGGEVSFCSGDCHLHVSVAEVTRDRDLRLRLRYRSDAAGRDEFPSELRVELVDAQGNRFRPTDGFPGGALAAGETVEREFRFAIPADDSARLAVSYTYWLDYLVPGKGNPLVQRRTSLALR